MAHDGDADLSEQELRDVAGNGSRRRLTGRCTLQNVTSVVRLVLQHPGEIGMAGSRRRHRPPGRPFPGRHLFRPAFPFGVADDHRDRTAERSAEPHPSEDLDLVPFQPHTWATAVPQPPTGKLLREPFRIKRQAGGSTFNDGRQGGSMGLACSEKADH